MNSTKRLILNSLTNCGRLVISLAVLFLLTPYILKKVGEADFGLWALVFSLLGFFSLLDFGVNTSVVKFVASGSGQENYHLRNRLLSTVGLLYLGLTLLGVLGVILLHCTFVDILSIPEAQHGKAKILLWIIGARVVFFALPLSLFRGILFGDQRIYLINLVQTVTAILYAFAAWGLLSLDVGIVGLAAANLIVMVVEYTLYAIFAFAFVKNLKIGWSLVDRSLIKETVSFSAYAFVPQVAALILLRTDPILVKLFLSLSAVAIYAIALKISENIHLLLKQFVNVLTPLVAELWGRGDFEGIRLVLMKGTKFSLVPTAMITAAVMVYSTEGLTFWVGPGFSEAGPVVRILTLATAVSIPQLIASTVLTMTGHHKYTARAAVFAAALNVMISVSLVGPLGLAGVALGTLAATLVVDVFLVLRKACLKCQVSPLEYARSSLAPLMLPTATHAILMVYLKQAFPPSGLIAIMMQTAAGFILFTVIFWFLGLDAGEKTFLKSHLRIWRRIHPVETTQEALS